VKYPVTPDGRYFVVRGRLWRMANPGLDEEERTGLISDPDLPSGVGSEHEGRREYLLRRPAVAVLIKEALVDGAFAARWTVLREIGTEQSGSRSGMERDRLVGQPHRRRTATQSDLNVLEAARADAVVARGPDVVQPCADGGVLDCRIEHQRLQIVEAWISGGPFDREES
jgi:hypothetical protein